MAQRAQRHTITHPEWRRRLWRSLYIGFGMLGLMLGLGVLGYHYIGEQEWSLAFLNASMILSGMGPIGDITKVDARIFASFYALFSGLLFVGVCGILSSPWVHLFLHRFRAELDDKED